ncbi:hypothetical protein FM106_09110 [Brachybacterium faecium]|nr:hypothetical protein FM106_09110 [Brachybacterium faecium]
MFLTLLKILLISSLMNVFYFSNFFLSPVATPILLQNFRTNKKH